MSSSCSPRRRNCVAVAAEPLIQARLLLCTSTVRRNNKVSLISNPASSSQGCSAAVQSNSALMSVRCAPSRTTPLSARAPKASWRASTRMDFPAPVSPVNAVKPPHNSKSSICTITKSRSMMRLRAMAVSLLHSSAVYCAGCQSSSTLADAKNARNIPNVSQVSGPHATERLKTAYQNWH